MTFDNIRLEKGLYATGKSFTQALEEIDPSENYAGTDLEGLDAYQRQLKRFGIKVSGKNSDPIEKFFCTSDSAALFPEYVARAVAQGIEEADLVSKIVATTTTINGLDYRAIAPDSTAGTFGTVNEGAVIPETKILTQNNLVTLHKRGRILCASYEAIRYQRLDVFTVALKQIGATIARAQLSDAVNVLINGDGNSNAAEGSTVASSGTLTYNDLIDFWNGFTPYSLTTIIASPDMLAKTLKLSEFRDVYTGLGLHSTGKLATPFGAELYKSPAVTEGTIIGLDRSCALEMVQACPVTTEYDKLIDRQLERAAITSLTGFSKIFAGATKTLALAAGA
ncbi:MAG: phage major capsid protein [Oscillospiraceae bacterium]|nr:phage major capsid protein [Oscillospiraceae bacterium]